MTDFGRKRFFHEIYLEFEKKSKEGGTYDHFLRRIRFCRSQGPEMGPKSGKKATSSKTGWAYNDRDFGGFEVNLKYKGFQPPVPGMAFVEGGTFMMGQTEENIMQDGSATRPRAVTVTSFWMDQTEITNLQYREYTYWMKRVFWERGDGEYSYLYTHSLPDSTVWRSELSYNEPMVNQYYRHPAYQDYPVVGVSCLLYTSDAADE